MEKVLSSSANTQKGSISIPSGCYLREIIQEETAGNKVIGGIKYGSSDGGQDIVAAFNIDPMEKDRIAIDGYVQPSVIFFDAVEGWNGASVDIYIIVGDLGS